MGDLINFLGAVIFWILSGTTKPFAQCLEERYITRNFWMGMVVLLILSGIGGHLILKSLEDEEEKNQPIDSAVEEVERDSSDVEAVYSPKTIQCWFEVLSDTGNIMGVDVVVYKRRKRGEFEFMDSLVYQTKREVVDLHFNWIYKLTFSMPGYEAKSIIFEALVPKNMQNEFFDPFKFTISLQSSTDPEAHLISKIAGKIFYSRSIEDFDYSVPKEEEEVRINL